jgi:hypothetical protein
LAETQRLGSPLSDQSRQRETPSGHSLLHRGENPYVTGNTGPGFP